MDLLLVLASIVVAGAVAIGSSATPRGERRPPID